MPVVMKLSPYYDPATLAMHIATGSALLQFEYLKSYDLEARRGRASVVLTRHLDQAMRFKDEATAMEAWREQSKTMPTRPDGKPNRPLTAYHATFEKVES